MGLLAALQLLTNLALQVVVLSIVGVGASTDAYVAAQAVPLLLISVLATSLQNVWQPRLAVLNNDVAARGVGQRHALGQAVIIFGVPVLILLLFSRIWVKLLFPGFSLAQVSLTVTMTQVLLVASFFNGHASLLTTFQRSRDRFVGPELAQLIAFIVAIAAVVPALQVFGIEAVPWVILGRSIVVCLVLYVMAERPAISPLEVLKKRDLWPGTAVLMAGSSIYKTGPLVDRFWISMAPAGSVTVFNLVQIGMNALAIVLDRAICVPAAPTLARFAQARDFTGLRRLYRQCVRRTVYAVIALPLLLVAIHPFWPTLAGAVLKVSPEFAEQMWVLSFMLLGYLIVAGCGYAVMASFYALGDMRTPVTIGVAGFLVGVVLKSAAFLQIGITGLAIATSAYYVLNLVVLILLLEKRIRDEVS
jgi:peptidoglycan biosynthesis protein MviN/MurJ (putative lipid II flippase)